MFGNSRRIEELENEVKSLKAQIAVAGKVGTMHWHRDDLISKEGRVVGRVYENTYEKKWVAKMDDNELGSYISRGSAVLAVEAMFDAIQKGKIAPRRQGNKTVYVSSGSGDSGPGLGTGLLIGMVAGSMLSHSYAAPASGDAASPSFSNDDASYSSFESDSSSSDGGSSDSGSSGSSDSGSSGGFDSGSLGGSDTAGF